MISRAYYDKVLELRDLGQELYLRMPSGKYRPVIQLGAVQFRPISNCVSLKVSIPTEGDEFGDIISLFVTAGIDDPCYDLHVNAYGEMIPVSWYVQDSQLCPRGVTPECTGCRDFNGPNCRFVNNYERIPV